MAIDEKMINPYALLLSKPCSLDRSETVIATSLYLKPVVLQV